MRVSDYEPRAAAGFLSFLIQKKNPNYLKLIVGIGNYLVFKLPP